MKSLGVLDYLLKKKKTLLWTLANCDKHYLQFWGKFIDYTNSYSIDYKNIRRLINNENNPYFLPWLYSTPSLSSLLQAPKTSGLRPMTKKDVPVVHRLLREYLSQFNLVPAMTPEEVEHWLLPQENIIDTYLVEV